MFRRLRIHRRAGTALIMALLLLTTLVSTGMAASDTVAPVITASVDRAPNSWGWHNQPVTVSFTCSDADSGIAYCPEPVILNTDGVGQSASGTAVDNAGNTATATVTGINIDLTAPTLTISGNKGTYLADEIVEITCEVTDDLSGFWKRECPEFGLPAHMHRSGTGNTVTYTARGFDRAGNVTEEVITFEIVVTADSGGDLIDGYVEHKGIAKSLQAKLKNAIAAAERGNNVAKEGIVLAFIKEVEALVGRHITPRQAEELILLVINL